MSDLTNDIIDHVYKQVRRCLGNVVGAGGHLASYTLSRETFRIARAETIDGEYVLYEFEGEGVLETEFLDVGTDEPELLQGTIVLDRNFQLTRGNDGRIRIYPWAVLDDPNK